MHAFLRGRASEIVSFIMIAGVLTWPIRSITGTSSDSGYLPMYGLLFLLVICLLEFKRTFESKLSIPLWFFQLLAAKMIITYTVPVLFVVLPKYQVTSPYILLPSLFGLLWGIMLGIQSWRGYDALWQSFHRSPNPAT